MVRRVHPTQSRLQELFTYSDGHLYWKISKGTRVYPGDIAGSSPNNTANYNLVTIDGVDYKSSRLIWIFHFGLIDDEFQIDHIDRNKKNDKIENLRLATKSMNRLNTKAYNTSSTLVAGVTFKPYCTNRPYEVRFVGAVVGYYDNLFDAVCARKSLENLHNVRGKHV